MYNWGLFNRVRSSLGKETAALTSLTSLLDWPVHAYCAARIAPTRILSYLINNAKKHGSICHQNSGRFTHKIGAFLSPKYDFF